MVRSILAVLAGYLTVAVAISVTFLVAFGTAVMAAPASFVPSVATMVALAAAGFVYAIGGGYLTAWIAKRAPMKHVVALALLGLALGVVSMIMNYGKEPPGFQIANLVIFPAGVFLGGRLRARRAPVASVG